jgi:serine/threonine-protein kinase
MSYTRIPRTTLVRVPAHDAAWTSPDDAYGSTVAPSSDDPTPAPLDDAVARYTARGALGEGGMGVVHLVLDRRIGRDVAMKTMRADRTTQGLLPRFVREAYVQGQLEHPSIVPVYDLGVDAADVPYFTMKRVHGTTLEQIVTALRNGDAEASQKYGRRKLLTAFASVCQAVEFAHARGVLHRDLKPSNVMLGDFGEVYVLDWGIAKVMAAQDDIVRPAITPAAGAATQTIVGVTMGTPGYMSPEQARAEPDLDERADVYALGAILFEMLCLEPLHRLHGVAAIAASQTEVDARPSSRAPNAMIPPELDDVCARAAAFRREARYPGVREMLGDLERFLDGDRDTERRRELAQRHAASAREAADIALSPTRPTRGGVRCARLGTRSRSTRRTRPRPRRSCVCSRSRPRSFPPTRWTSFTRRRTRRSARPRAARSWDTSRGSRSSRSASGWAFAARASRSPARFCGRSPRAPRTLRCDVRVSRTARAPQRSSRPRPPRHLPASSVDPTFWFRHSQ